MSLKDSLQRKLKTQASAWREQIDKLKQTTTESKLRSNRTYQRRFMILKSVSTAHMASWKNSDPPVKKDLAT
jgi:uncharacterized coiled-coil DUF342 family protein